MYLVDSAPRQHTTHASRPTLVDIYGGAQPVSAPVGGLAGRLLLILRGLMSSGLLTVRMQPRRKELRVIETLSLGAKKQVVLVSCKGERFLVGTGADSVDTIVRLRAYAPDEAEGLS